MPARFLAVGALVLVLAVVWRRPLAESLRSGWSAARAHLRDAGPVHLLALCVVCVAGVLLRWHFVHGPMRWDESYTFLHFGLPSLGEGLNTYDSPNNHALNTLLMHVSYSLFGSGEAALRAPVFVAGVLLPPAGYLAAARLHDRRVALVAAAMLATSPQLVEFATNARGYEIAALFAALAVAIAPSLLRSTNPVPWALFALVAALGFYTVAVFAYPFAVVVGALAAAALFGQTQQRRIAFLLCLAATTLAAVALAAVLYGPIADDVLRYVREGSYSDDGWQVVEDVWEVWTLGLPWIGRIALLAGFAVSVVAVPRRYRRSLPLAAMFALLVLAALGLGRVVPLTRVFLPLLPIFLIVSLGGLLGHPSVARILARRPAELALSVASAAIAVGFGMKVSADRLPDSEGSALPAGATIVELVKPQLASTEDQILITTSAHPILQYELFRSSLPPGYAYGTLSPAMAATGQTFVVVNEGAGETLPSVIASVAPGTGLRPVGRLLGRFRGATVYEVTR
jgi:hypothetical protein